MPLEFFNRLGMRVSSFVPSWSVRHLALLRRRIASAGDLEISPEALFGIQVIGAIFMPVFALFILKNIMIADFLFGGPHTAVLAVGLVFLGYSFPKMNLQERVAKRQQSIVIEMPSMMDLLAVCVEAGMDFLSALRVVVRNQKTGPLKEEFERFLKQLELGVPRVDALHEMSRRVDVPDMGSFCAVMVQATRLGAPLGPILKNQADLLRIRRGQRAEKAAAQASVKVLMPLALCIFPAVFIAILGPVIIQIQEVMHQ